MKSFSPILITAGIWRIVSVDGREGPANQNRLCVKGRFGFDYVHNPQRLTKPLIRKDGVPKNPKERVNPDNPLTHFREATWEEALDLAAKKLAKIRDEVGSKSLAGFGCAKGSNEEAYLFQKLVRTGFKNNNVELKNSTGNLLFLNRNYLSHTMCWINNKLI